MVQKPISETDEGKQVIDADGEQIGIVSGVRNGTAYVDPDPGIGEKILSKLGWENIDEDDYPLEHSKIAEITDKEIRLSRNL